MLAKLRPCSPPNGELYTLQEYCAFLHASRLAMSSIVVD